MNTDKLTCFRSITSSKSIADLEEENSRLLETKNALNIVKDDLLKELEEMTNRYATVKVEFEKSMKEKGESGSSTSLHSARKLFYLFFQMQFTSGSVLLKQICKSCDYLLTTKKKMKKTNQLKNESDSRASRWPEF